jgi:uncharacterized protein (TIGR02996 family)
MSRDALLRAIAAAPDDDTPRLVFADWLDEYGDAHDRSHAELIRAQIELARLPLHDDRRGELGAIEKRNWHRVDWRERYGAPPCVLRQLARGFPECVGFDWNARRGHLSEADIAQMTEAIERFPIRAFEGDLLGSTAERRGGLELLAEWPALARLTALEATSGIGMYEERESFAPGLDALAESPHARGLRRVCFAGWQLSRDALNAFAYRLPQLVELDVFQDDGDTIANELVDALLCTPLPDRLERLGCAWVDLPPAPLREFLDRAPLRALAFGVPLDAETGVGPLLGAPGLVGLRELRITGEAHGFSTDEMPGESECRVIPHLRELLASPGLAGLEVLSVRGVALGDAGARALAESPMAASLAELDLSLCGLTDAGLLALRPLLTGGRLRRLRIGHNTFERAGVEELVSWPEFGRLHALEFGYFNYLEDEDRALLKASPNRHPFLDVM